MKPPLIIYHGSCNDGFTAAWIAKKALDADKETWHRSAGTPFPHAPAELREAQYGDADKFTLDDIADRLVFILDFSFPRKIMEQMATWAHIVIWIDHHKTAIDESGDLLKDPRLHIDGVLDTNRSGAWLTWEWFHGTDAVPDIVKMVDDRDRWQFKLPNTRYFHAGLNLRSYSMDEWDTAARSPEDVIADGVPAVAAHMEKVRANLDANTVTKIIDGFPVPTCKVEYSSASDSCHELLGRFPAAKFAATWFDTEDGQRKYSLRSRTGSDVDVSAIAKKFGGGGHKHAAGFSVPANLDNGRLVP